MKKLQFLLLIGFVALNSASPLASSNASSHINAECSKGIVFWCSNVLNAKKCNAVDFCIQSVWETHIIKEDSGIICEDCKEWVGKARSFIEREDRSGEVVKSLRWTCDLIPVRALRDSCEKLVDESVPEIFQMLEASLNPNVVCSKLFFCNNAEYDKVLEDHSMPSEKLLPFTCGQCHHIGSIIEKKFQKSEHDDILEKLLMACGEMSSFSDSCSSIVMMYFDELYQGMASKLSSKNLCQMSGSCVDQYQKEGIVDIIPGSSEEAEIPCELCQQLVLHLRELLIANTTKTEFRNIMIGFCHQMGSFSNECIDLTYQYSDVLYDFLVDKLNANKACVLIEICPSKDQKQNFFMPTMPLVSTEIHPAPKQQNSFESTDSSLTLVKNGNWCTTCDYFVHFVQEALRKQSTDDKIISGMKHECKALPKKVQGDCVALVDLYGDIILSLVAQNMDPRYICPKVKLCPPNLTLDYISKTTVGEKPTCPFCLMALQEVRDVLASNVTKQNIESVLGKLCIHLSDKLMSVCTEFVKDYSDEVVDMILADFTPQEACTFIKLCTDDKVEYGNAKIVVEEDFDDSEVKQEMLANPQCDLCKEIVEIVEQRVINKKSKDEIRRELENSCNRLRKFADKCKSFVDKYSDRIVDLIERELEPEQVCKEMMFCVAVNDPEIQDYDSGLDILVRSEKEPDEAIKEQPQCVMCEFIMSKLDAELNDKKTDEEIKNSLRTVCSKLPSSVGKSCKQFVDYYFDMLIVLLETMKPAEVCGYMKLCPTPKFDDVKMIESIENELVDCAVCKGLVEGIDTVIEDPGTDTNIENLEEKLCEKFVGKYRPKCQDLTKNYGLLIINLLKNLTDSDQICYKLKLCSINNDVNFTGMLQLR